jgi:hypothetical protein
MNRGERPSLAMGVPRQLVSPSKSWACSVGPGSCFQRQNMLPLLLWAGRTRSSGTEVGAAQWVPGPQLYSSLMGTHALY